jgi:hypothetical protein
VRHGIAVAVLVIVTIVAAAWPSRHAQAATGATGRAPATMAPLLSSVRAMAPDVGPPNCSAAGPPPSARLEVMIGALLLLFANRGGPRRRRRT